MFGEFFGLPLHPLMVHATVMFVMATVIGVTALACRPSWRHKYGYLLIIISWLAVLSTWIAVESGNVLTEYPGLGSAEHAGGGTVLLFMLIPYAVIVTSMILLDKRWLWNVNKHGDTYRLKDKQPKLLSAFCLFSVLAGLVVAGQVSWVGHTGAVASWGNVDLDQPFISYVEQPVPDPIVHEGRFGGKIRLW